MQRQNHHLGVHVAALGLNPPDQATSYAPSAKGYTDYPVLQAA